MHGSFGRNERGLRMTVSDRERESAKNVMKMATQFRCHRWILLWLVLCLSPSWAQSQGGSPRVQAVGAIGITVSDMDRAVDFYSRVLTFEKVADVEVAGDTYEHLQGLFGLRMRVVRMRLGDEFIELTEYIAA